MKRLLFSLMFVGLLIQSGCNTREIEYDFKQMDLPSGSFGTQALGVNDNGSIVGFKPEHPTGFVYQKGEISSIQLPTTSISARPVGINNSGDIVGSYADGDTNLSRAFLSKGKIIIDIAPPAISHIRPAVKAYSYAYGINSRGDVVGYYVDNRGGHGFLYNGIIHVDLDFPIRHPRHRHQR